MTDIFKDHRLRFNITDYCNFACKTCLREYTHKYHLSIDIIKKVLDETKKYGIKQVGFTGGEPALHPDFYEIVDLVTRSGMNFRLISNGSLLARYAQIEKKYHKLLTLFYFSLDGSTAKTHDFIRRKGSFEQVKESISYFVSKNIPTETVVTLNKLNQHEIKDIITLSLKLGAVKVNFLNAIRTKYNSGIVLDKKEKIECLKQIIKYSRIYKSDTLLIGCSLYTGEHVNICPDLDNYNSCIINPKGELAYCYNIIRFGYNVAIGSLKNHTYLELYAKYKKVALGMSKLRENFIKKNHTFGGFDTCEFCNLCFEST